MSDYTLDAMLPYRHVNQPISLSEPVLLAVKQIAVSEHTYMSRVIDLILYQHPRVKAEIERMGNHGRK